MGVTWIIWIQAFFKGSYNQIILGWILMIVQELSSIGGGLRSPSALIYDVLPIFLSLIYLRMYGYEKIFITDENRSIIKTILDPFSDIKQGTKKRLQFVFGTNVFSGPLDICLIISNFPVSTKIPKRTTWVLGGTNFLLRIVRHNSLNCNLL